jgi:hypothetical protein
MIIIFIFYIYLNYFRKEDKTKYGVVSFELEIIN